ncbi:MAG TPA: hypothetical protein VLL52_04715 [Anaerolineae bacterium]|nr:hypothetical protein [Anaerolineae bacterium]
MPKLISEWHNSDKWESNEFVLAINHELKQDISYILSYIHVIEMGLERNDEQVENWLGEVKLRCLKIEKLTQIMDQWRNNMLE